jgi:molecular chaperone DnaK
MGAAIYAASEGAEGAEGAAPGEPGTDAGDGDEDVVDAEIVDEDGPDTGESK